MTQQELQFKSVENVKPDERCLIELGARDQEGGSNLYAVVKITRIDRNRFLLRVRGSDGQTIRMFVESKRLLAVVSEELYQTILTL